MTSPARSDNSFLSQFSLLRLIESFRQSVQMFPLTVVSLLALTLWAWMDIRQLFKTSDSVEMALWFFLGIESLFTAAATIWCDYFKLDKRRTGIVQAVGTALLLGDFFYILFNGTAMSSEAWIGHSAMAVAFTVAILFVPDSKNDTASTWFFSFFQINNLVFAVLLGIALTLAVSIIYITVRELFNISGDRTYFCAVFAAGVTLPALLFLSRIPTHEEIVDSAASYEPSRLVVGLVKFLVLPLAVVYMAIIYIYGIQVVVNLELPRGVDSSGVAGLMAAVVFVIFMFEPLRSSRFRADDGFTRFAYKVLPVAMFPLLALMSVAIGYRIWQYGITPARLYVAAFNIWCYGVTAWLVVRRGHGINRIAMSFAIVFVLTSAIPYANFTSLSDGYITWRVKALLRSAGGTSMPLDRKQFTDVVASMDEKTREEVQSKMKYLDRYDDHSRVHGIIDFPYATSSWEYDESVFALEETRYDIQIPAVALADEYEFIAIPEGYDSVRKLSAYDYNDIKTVGPLYNMNFDGVEFSLNLDRMIAYDRDRDGFPIKVEGTLSDSTKVLVNLTKIEGKVVKYGDGSYMVDYINLSGFVFK